MPKVLRPYNSEASRQGNQSVIILLMCKPSRNHIFKIVGSIFIFLKLLILLLSTVKSKMAVASKAFSTQM